VAYLAVGLGLFVFHSTWGALLGFHIALVGALVMIKPDIPISILYKSRNLKWIPVSLLLTGTSGIALYFLWDRFHVAGDLPAQLERLGLTASTWPAFITYFAAVNPFVEEYFWRGVLGDTTGNLHPSDFLYAGFHAIILIGKVPAGSIFIALVILTLAGWLWRQIAREDGGLLAPVLGHMAADFSILLAVYSMTT
jgi:membrane protease YdiL (CAAX protease family)